MSTSDAMENQVLIGRRFCVGLLLLLCHQPTAADTNCSPGIISLGYTSPAGDLYTAMGSQLVINCTLNSVNDHLNSSHTFWEMNQENKEPLSNPVNASYVTVLDPTTAQLHFPKMEKGKYTALCRARNSSGFLSDVCWNTVYVGDYPAENVSIKCTSYDFINITCRWKLPLTEKYSRANWTFKHVTSRNRDENCTQPINDLNEGCTFKKNFCTVMHPYFVLKGKNKFGSSSTKYLFDQYKNVAISPPTPMNSTILTESSAHISWNSPVSEINCVSSPGNLNAFIEYQIFVRKTNQREPYKYTVNDITKQKSYFLDALTPYTDYWVDLRSRFMYKGYKNSWGESTSFEFRTDAGVPAAPPKTAVGVKTTDGKLMEMNVTLYWTGIPEEEHFGKNFSYSIEILQTNPRHVETVHTAETYLSLPRLPIQLVNESNQPINYMFRVRAANEIGESKLSSDFIVSETDVNDNLDIHVDDVIVVDNEVGPWNYIVSWTVPDKKDYNIILYWCFGNRTRHGLIECSESGLHSQEGVASDEANYTFTLPNPSPSEHLFGIATVDPYQSQRMVWSSCNIPASRPPKSPTFNFKGLGLTWVNVTWEPLQCEDKAVRMTGYRVHVYNAGDQDIEGSPFNVRKNVTTYNVTNLQPHSLYKVAVTTMTLRGESKSVPKNAWTLGARLEESSSGYLYVIFGSLLGFCGLLFAGYYAYRWYRKTKADRKTYSPAGTITEWHL